MTNAKKRWGPWTAEDAAAARAKADPYADDPKPIYTISVDVIPPAGQRGDDWYREMANLLLSAVQEAAFQWGTLAPAYTEVSISFESHLDKVDMAVSGGVFS